MIYDRQSKKLKNLPFNINSFSIKITFYNYKINCKGIDFNLSFCFVFTQTKMARIKPQRKKRSFKIFLVNHCYNRIKKEIFVQMTKSRYNVTDLPIFYRVFDFLNYYLGG